MGDIRAMTKKDKDAIVEMMREFYASPAVLSNGSENIFQADVDACVAGSPYVEGYVFERDGDIRGYAMVAKSFSTEFGKPCVWIEDLYIKAPYRGMGIASGFLEFIETIYPHAVFRLEVEEENVRAVEVYRKHGFAFLPYKEMVK